MHKFRCFIPISLENAQSIVNVGVWCLFCYSNAGILMLEIS